MLAVEIDLKEFLLCQPFYNLQEFFAAKPSNGHPSHTPKCSFRHYHGSNAT